MTTCCLTGALESSLAYSQSFCPSPRHLFLQPQGVKGLVDELLVPVSSEQTYLSTAARSATSSFWDWMSPFIPSLQHFVVSGFQGLICFKSSWTQVGEMYISERTTKIWATSERKKFYEGKEEEIGTVTKMANKTHTHSCMNTRRQQTDVTVISEFPLLLQSAYPRDPCHG